MRKHLTYANIMSTFAVMAVLAGGTAVAANTVFSTDIVNGEVRTVDLDNDAVSPAKLGTVSFKEAAGQVSTSSETLVSLSGGPAVPVNLKDDSFLQFYASILVDAPVDGLDATACTVALVSASLPFPSITVGSATNTTGFKQVGSAAFGWHVPAGSHTFRLKYRKENTGSTNDCVFKERKLWVNVFEG